MTTPEEFKVLEVPKGQADDTSQTGEPESQPIPEEFTVIDQSPTGETWGERAERKGISRETARISPTATEAVPEAFTGEERRTARESMAREYAQRQGGIEGAVAEAVIPEAEQRQADAHLKSKVARIRNIMGANRVFGTITEARQTELEDSIKDIAAIAGYEDVKRRNDGVLVAFMDGNEYEIDGDFFDRLGFDLMAQGFEIGGATGGAVAGTRMGRTPVQKLVGAGLGSAIGAFTGSVLDDVQAAVELDRTFNLSESAQKAEEAAWLDLAGTSAAAGILKSAGVTKNVANKIKEYAKGNLSGAKKILKEDYGMTDESIDKAFEDMKLYQEEATGGTKEKLLAATLQEPKAQRVLEPAIKNDAKAAIETSKTIDERAKRLNESLKEEAAKPEDITPMFKEYERDVKAFYSDMSDTFSDAFAGVRYRVNPDIFQTETLDEIKSRIADQTVADRLQAHINTFKAATTMDDLLDSRRMINRFYRKNKNQIDLAQDKRMLSEIIDNIDSEIINVTEQVFTEDTAGDLIKYFEDANKKYSDMFKAQDTSAYKKLTVPGLDADQIADRVLKSMGSVDEDLQTALKDIPMEKRKAVEFTALSKLARNNTKEYGGLQVIDYQKMAENIDGIKKNLVSDEAKKAVDNIKLYAEKFPNEKYMQQIASGAREREEKNIATTVRGKAAMKLASMQFSLFQRLIGTPTGNRLALQKAVGDALRKSRTPADIYKNLAKNEATTTAEKEAFRQATKEAVRMEKEAMGGDNLQEEAEQVFPASPSAGSGVLSGTYAGVTQNEDGSITVDPEAFVLGAIGGAGAYKSAEKVAQNYKSNPYFRRKIDTAIKKIGKESPEAADQVSRSIKGKYPQLNIKRKK